VAKTPLGKWLRGPLKTQTKSIEFSVDAGKVRVKG
jgi:hypothetical protein